VSNRYYIGKGSNNFVELQVGDVLLYKPNGFFGRFIAIKTWSQVSHAELYMGDGVAYASRDKIGVGYYGFRTSELVRVRRPRILPDYPRLEEFCTDTIGQKYDWFGLARFFNVGAGKQDRMFCSEAVTRALRWAGVELFDERKDADAVSPGELDYTPALETIWSASDRRAFAPTGPAFGG
jgi:hypothetical protein